MKSLTSLWRELANETASWCGTSADRDCKTVAVRTEAEGDAFLRITLPRLGKAFERWLEAGKVDPSLVTSFKWREGLPVFLQGFLGQIFSADGALLDEPSVECISAVRMLTHAFGKIAGPCSPRRERRAMLRYVEIEQELEGMDSSGFEEFLPLFRKASTLLWADIFAGVENHVTGSASLTAKWAVAHPNGRARMRTDLSILEIFGVKPVGGISQGSEQSLATLVDPFDPGSPTLIPKHGPGATADGLTGNGKFDLRYWPQRLDDVLPYGEYGVANACHDDKFDHVQFVEPGKEMAVKVIAVPKTLKTPRIIAKEPTSVQYGQQALLQQFVENLQNGSPIWSEVPTSETVSQKDCGLGRHFIGIKDQEPNRLLAREGSHHGNLATLDLSEASDRVLNQHVLLLMSRFPRLSAAVQGTRSTKADVPGHGVIPLIKFASMGSALTFPIEAMVFTTIIFAAIAKQRRVPLTRGLILSLRSQVRVYGDDIVVPVEYVHSVISALEAFGLRVNADKSFWDGKFRESCGGDYYAGEWVTPIRLRKALPQSLADVDEVVGLVAFRNLLYWGGYWRTAAYIDRSLRRLLRGNYPVVDVTSAVLGRESVLGFRPNWFSTVETRLHPSTHVPLRRGAVVKSRIPKSTCSGEGALLKFFLKRSVIPSQDRNHLERQGRPEAVRIKLRWVRPY